MDRSKWSFANYMNGSSDLLLKETADVAAITSDSDNNGVLRLTSAQYSAGKFKAPRSVTTGEHMTFKYGYLEIRAKVPVSQGVWPAFWLKSETTPNAELAKKLGYNSNSVYETEVDIFEGFGSRAEAVPNLHKWWKTEEQKKLFGNDRVSSGAASTYKITDNGWHTYGMLWTPYEISMLVDGVCYTSYNLNINFSDAKSADIGMEDFNNPLCIIFNNHLFTPAYTSAAGGEWAKNYTVESDFKQAVFDIDYVRLYQRPDESEIYFAD